ncbi:MAG: YihY/virulence factor BrkB family protein [Chloroflexota bacterium]
MISQRIKDLYQRADRISGNRFNILKDAIETFKVTRANQASASLAFFIIFSLFPLLLVLISAGGFILDSEQVYLKVSQLVRQNIPASYEWIDENLRSILDQRGAVGIIGLITLTWAASGGFMSLAYNINLAWLEAPQRNFFQGRLIALQMTAGLSGLFLLSLMFDSIINLLHIFNVPFVSFLDVFLWKWFSNIFSWLIIFLLFSVLYYWLPTVNVTRSAALWGALMASLAWKSATTLFSWYVRSGLGRYEVIYGSVGALVAFLFLVYMLATVALFGAHLASAIDRRIKLNRTAGDATSSEDMKG